MPDYDIGAAFAAIEEELISSMMRNLNRHRAEEDAEGYLWSQWQTEQLKALEDYKRQNQKQYGKQFRSINEKLEQALREAYAQGETEQEAAILRAIRDGAQLWRPGGSLRSTFFQLNERKLEALIQATTGDMARAETAILRRTNDQYRKVIYNAQVYANTGAGTYEKAVDMATKDFLSAGIQCVVYQNGARHTLSDYADMALRTAAKRAYLQGEGSKRQEWGVSTVIINRRGGACPQCAKFCGKVFIDDVWSGGSREDGDYPLLSRAIEQGLYHPRCKDSHSTWFQELHEDERPYTEKEIAQLEGRERQEQKEQNARRQAEKYRRLERYSLDGENRKKYGARAAEWEKAVVNTGNSGILKDTETGIYSVTSEVIDSVPKIRPVGWTEEAAGRLRTAHQELLSAVQKLRPGTEAGAVYDADMNLIERVIGTAGRVDLPAESRPHTLIHNHPSGLTFSEADIHSFLNRPELEVLTAVGNNGAVYLIQKTDSYNAAELAKAFVLEGKALAKAETAEAYAAEMNRFLKEAERYGVQFITGG